MIRFTCVILSPEEVFTIHFGSQSWSHSILSVDPVSWVRVRTRVEALTDGRSRDQGMTRDQYLECLSQWILLASFGRFLVCLFVFLVWSRNWRLLRLRLYCPSLSPISVSTFLFFPANKSSLLSCRERRIS